MRQGDAGSERLGLPPIRFVVDGPVDQPTGGYIYDRLVIDGLRVRGIPVDIVSLEHARRRALVGENVRFCRELGRPGIVIADELCHPRMLAGAWVRRLRPVGSVLRIPRGGARLITLVHHLAASERRGLGAAVRLAFERPLLLASDRIIVTSDTTGAQVVQAGADPARVRVVKPGRDRLGVRAAPPMRPRAAPLRLLFIGSLSPRKDPLALVRAFAAVRDRAVLTLAGPVDRHPSYAARVRALAASHGERIRVAGCLGDQALEVELDRHDVFVLPSRYEGFGIAVAEALSHGLAVVAARAGALPEVVRDGQEACLVEPGDDVALGRVLCALAGDSAIVARMQAKALARAAELPVWADAQQAFADAVFQ